MAFRTRLRPVLRGAGTWTMARACSGVAVTVRANSDAFRSEVLDALPAGNTVAAPGATDIAYDIEWSSSTSGEHRLYQDQELLVQTRDSEALLLALQTDSTWRVACEAPDHVYIHAGAVGDGEAGLILPGNSGAGKSTLVRHLLGRGLVYFSDEYAAIDAAGQVHPYPCPLKVKSGTDRVDRIPARALTNRIATGPVPVNLIVFPRFVPRASASLTPLTPLTPGQAAHMLLNHIPAARQNPLRAFETAACLARNAESFAAEYGDSEAAVHFVLDCLAARRDG